MSMFKFRLATLLRIREALRDERHLALAEAYQADDVLRQRQEALAAELNGLKGTCRQAVAPGQVDVDGLLEAQRYEMTLRAAARRSRNTARSSAPKSSVAARP
jgi:flagellar protein FliJ